MNPRRVLAGMVTKTGAVRDAGSVSEHVEVTASAVLALARTGKLDKKDLGTVDLILAKQEPDGCFEDETTRVNVEAIQALVAAREQGVRVLGQTRIEAIETALASAGGYLESLQEESGGVRESNSNDATYDPSVKSTSFGAVGLALTGRKASAEQAAKWVSRYQVTAEYAGAGNPENGEHAPAEDLIGAFLPNESALRNALADGVGSNDRYGLYGEAQQPTAWALLALVTAGPYGP